MRDAVLGIRPTNAFVVAHINALAAAGAARSALVATAAANALHVRLPPATLVAVCDLFARGGREPGAEDALRRVIDAVLSGGSVLNSEQLETLIAACSTQHMPDRGLAIAVHSVERGWRPTSRAAVSIVDAIALKAAGLPPNEVAGLYAQALSMMRAADVTLDAALARAMLRLLCGVRAIAFRAARKSGKKDAIQQTQGQQQLLQRQPGHEHSGGDDALLEEAFAFVARLPPGPAGDAGVLTELMLGALRRGRRDRALQVLGAMQARRIRPPAAAFNALITADAALPPLTSTVGGTQLPPGAPMSHAAVYLRLMRDAGVVADRGTLLALTKAALYRSVGGTGAADVLRSLSLATGVPLDQRVVGTAAFYAAKYGNFNEVERILQLLRLLPVVAGGSGVEDWRGSNATTSERSLNNAVAGSQPGNDDRRHGRMPDGLPPRWLHKLSNFMTRVTAVAPKDGAASHPRR